MSELPAAHVKLLFRRGKCLKDRWRTDDEGEKGSLDLDQMTRAAVFKEAEDKKNGQDTTQSQLGGGGRRLEKGYERNNAFHPAEQQWQGWRGKKGYQCLKT